MGHPCAGRTLDDASVKIQRRSDDGPTSLGRLPRGGAKIGDPPRRVFRLIGRTTGDMFVAISTAAILTAAGGCGTNSPARPAVSSTARPSKSVTSAAPSPSPTPTVVKRRVTVTKRIPYKTRRVTDPSLARGHMEIRIKGRSGIRTLMYAVTYVNGERNARD